MRVSRVVRPLSVQRLNEVGLGIGDAAWLFSTTRPPSRVKVTGFGCGLVVARRKGCAEFFVDPRKLRPLSAWTR